MPRKNGDPNKRFVCVNTHPHFACQRPARVCEGARSSDENNETSRDARHHRAAGGDALQKPIARRTRRRRDRRTLRARQQIDVSRQGLGIREMRESAERENPATATSRFRSGGRTGAGEPSPPAGGESGRVKPIQTYGTVHHRFRSSADES